MSIEIIERLGPYEERTKKHEYENINKGTYIQSIHTSTKLWTSRWRPRPCLPHPTPTAHHRDPPPTCPAKNVYTLYDKTEQRIIYHTTMESDDVRISFTTQQWKVLTSAYHLSHNNGKC